MSGKPMDICITHVDEHDIAWGRDANNPSAGPYKLGKVVERNGDELVIEGEFAAGDEWRTAWRGTGVA